MKRILTAVCLTAMTMTAVAQEAHFSYFKYAGNDARFQQQYDAEKQYLNPIL